jgi:hypothetical protein
MTGDLSFGDNDKAKFGAGSDLQIYHDGSNSYIKDVGSGQLRLVTDGSEIAMLTQGGLEYGVRIIQDGAVEIRHDDSTKLNTTSTGIDVTGNTVTDKVQTENLYRTGVNGSGIHFSTNATLPTNETSAVSNGTEDLGSNAYRWKNLYLSGSIANSSGDLTLDVGGNIVLDADGGGVYFKDAGTNIGFLQNSGANDFRIVAGQQDKDIVFMGNDNGSTITALTLDMSNAGAATFNSSITATGGVSAGGFSSDGHITGQYIYRTGVNGSGFHFTTNAIYPVNESGSLTNGTESLGSSSYKYNNVYANNFHGDGSNLTGVGGSTNAGAVGTYGYFKNTTGSNILWGSTTSGSNLIPSNAIGINYSSSTVSGTWRAMGDSHTNYTESLTTLWVRIS